MYDTISYPQMKIETFAEADNLTLGRLLGTGQFNYVYEACIREGGGGTGNYEDSKEEEDSQRSCDSESSSYVVKHLKESLAEEDSDAFEVGASDLAHEAEILSTVAHENIVKFHGVIPFSSPSSVTAPKGASHWDLVLEKLQCTLTDRIHGLWRSEERQYRRGALPLQSPILCRAKCQELLSARLNAALQLSRGLQHLHSLGIMHRDLKPDNIGFDASGTIKIFDFGLSKRIVPGRRHTGLVGTFRYMAPEVAKCKNYNLSADTHSYGLILWEICALETVYGQITRRDFQDKIVFGDKRPRLSSSWSSSLKGLMALCWSIDKSERPSWDIVIAILEQEMNRVHSEDAPQRRRRFGRRSSMPMLGTQHTGQSAKDCVPSSDQASSAHYDAEPVEKPKRNRPTFGRRSSMPMVMQTTTGPSPGTEVVEKDSNERHYHAMGDRPLFPKQRSFSRRPSMF